MNKTFTPEIATEPDTVVERKQTIFSYLKIALLSVICLVGTVGTYGAELINASWTSSNSQAGATATYTFSYQIVTPDPVFAFYAVFPSGFVCLDISNVTITINGTAAALDASSSSVNGAICRLRLVNRQLATAGANVVVTAKVINASTAGSKGWTFIRTADGAGRVIDEISSPARITIVPAAPGTSVATEASLVSSSGFQANWSATADASSYSIDVSAESDFSTFVTGYEDLTVGNVLSVKVSGLAPVTTYYYRVRASNVSGTGSSSDAVTVTTTKADASVSLTDLMVTYDGTRKSPTVTTDPADLDVVLTYNGSADVPVNAGTYEVTATIHDEAFQGTANATLVIEKATATIILPEDLAVVYDGSPKPVTVMTIPEGLTVDVTYDGVAFAPSAAGIYEIIATISDVNYQGSISENMEISILTGLQKTGISGVQLYPNPAKDFIVIRAEGRAKSIRIVDMTGNELIKMGNVSVNDKIDVRSLNQGVYNVIVESEAGNAWYRLVLE